MVGGGGASTLLSHLLSPRLSTSNSSISQPGTPSALPMVCPQKGWTASSSHGKKKRYNFLLLSLGQLCLQYTRSLLQVITGPSTTSLGPTHPQETRPTPSSSCHLDCHTHTPPPVVLISLGQRAQGVNELKVTYDY